MTMARAQHFEVFLTRGDTGSLCASRAVWPDEKWLNRIAPQSRDRGEAIKNPSFESTSCQNGESYIDSFPFRVTIALSAGFLSFCFEMKRAVVSAKTTLQPSAPPRPNARIRP